MDGHAAVLDGQRALALAGLVRVEHAAVGVEFSGIDAVGQGGLGGSRFFLCRGGLFRFRDRLGLGGFILRRLCLCGAAGQHGQQHHRCQQQGKNLILFHNSISLFVIERSPAEAVRMEGSTFYLQTRDLSSYPRAS